MAVATVATGLAASAAAPADALTNQLSGALDAAGPLVEPALPVFRTSEGLATADGQVRLADDAGGVVRVADGAGAVSVTLPGEADAAATVTSDGVTYRGIAVDTDLIAAPTADGAQLIAVLGSAEAPTEIAFDVDAGAGASLRPQEDGSIALLSTRVTPDGSTLTAQRGVFEAPWAVDALGTAVPTHYRLDGQRLVQVVEPTAATVYPVAADPSFKFTLFGAYAHWSRSEAKKFAGATVGTVAAAVGLMCAGTPFVAACTVAAPGIVAALAGISDFAIDKIYDNGSRLTTRLFSPILTYVERS